MESFAPYNSFSGNISGMGREPMPNIYMPSHNLGGGPIASQTFNGNGIAVAGLTRCGSNQHGMQSMRGFMKANGNTRPMMTDTQAFSSAAPLGKYLNNLNISGPARLSDNQYYSNIPRHNIIRGPRPIRLPNAPKLNHNMGGNCSDNMVRGRWGPQMGAQSGDPILTRLKQNILNTVNKLKIQPNWSDLTNDGGALWKYSNLIKGNSIWCRVFNRVEICAERHTHRKPVPYFATLSTTTKIKLDPIVAKQVQCLLPQIGYCSSDNVLRISMDSLEHNLAILAIVCGIQQGKLNIYQVRRNKLVEKYLQLTTPGHRRYHPHAKYNLIKFIRTPKKK